MHSKWWLLLFSWLQTSLIFSSHRCPGAEVCGGQPGWGHLLGTAIRPPSAPSKTLSYGDAGRAVFSTRGIQAPCPGSVWFGPFSARHVLHVALCDSFVLNGDSRWRVN